MFTYLDLILITTYYYVPSQYEEHAAGMHQIVQVSPTASRYNPYTLRQRVLPTLSRSRNRHEHRSPLNSERGHTK